MKVSRPLKQNSDFRRLYARGKSAAGPYMVLYCGKNRLGLNRLGITASKKLGGAVKRNRIRRRVREVYRLSEHLLRPGVDLVIVARFRALDGNFSKMSESFLSLAGGLGILRT